MWSDLPPEEVERRRLSSVEAMKGREAEAFAAWYQEWCDRKYWVEGQCCAGCDHWQSKAGGIGRCTAAGIMSGADVVRSLGWSFCSYTPEPGFPFSRAEDHCSKFLDSFDWTTLPESYLVKIKAAKNGKLHPKPTMRSTVRKSNIAWETC